MTNKENILAWLRREEYDFEPDISFTGAGMSPDLHELDVPVCERPMEKSGYDVFSVHWTAAVSGCHWTQGQDVIIKDILNWRNEVKFPKVERFDWDSLAEQAKYIDRKNKVVCFATMMGCFERTTTLSTFTDCLTNTITETGEYAALINAIADYKIAVINKAADVAAPEVICYHDDWGTMRSPFMSHELWRETLFPATKRIFDAAKTRGILVCLHSCGNVSSLLPDMIELGVDIWEGQAACNDLPKLYDQYNDKLRVSLFATKPKPAPSDDGPPQSPFQGAYVTPYAQKPEFLWRG